MCLTTPVQQMNSQIKQFYHTGNSNIAIIVSQINEPYYTHYYANLPTIASSTII